MEMWINPACTKCRIAADALDGAGANYTQRRYLDQPPTTQELEDVLTRLSLEPWDITRMNEPQAAPLKDTPQDPEHRKEWIDALVATPRLIQRPIITLDDGSAVVARDPETLAQIIRDNVAAIPE